MSELMQYDPMNQQMVNLNQMMIDQQQQQQQQGPKTLDHIIDAINECNQKKIFVPMNDLLAHLRNVIGISVDQPRYVVNRLHNNMIIQQHIGETELLKPLKNVVVTYQEIMSTSLDKIIKKKGFQESCDIVRRSANGFWEKLVPQ
jgi:hypothetical protein